MTENHDKPMATYRLQFNQQFRLTDAHALVLYFSRLGVTHLYASPILRARKGSSHGYDVVDPKTINPDLGNETDLMNLADDLGNFGLGLILDIVPNHMAASIENPYWRDVLTYGHSSPFAGWFDIDWRMPDPDMWGRVLVPVLGAPRSQVVEQDEIRVTWSDGRFVVEYYEHVFPIDPATVPRICEFGLDELEASLPDDHPALGKIAEILASLKRLPKLAARLRRRVDIDRDATEQLLADFAHLVVQSPRIEQWAVETAERFGNGSSGKNRLKKLLDCQPYRLVHWRAAARTINYRRFFDINELISVRQEDPQVFEDTHATVLRWVREGLIDGLRIDHVDGLRDPLGYLHRLSEALSKPDRTGNVPVFVEKILAPHEKLPCGWPVAGTTGYEFLNRLEAVLIDRAGFERIEQDYRRLLRRPVHFQEVALWGKRRVLRNDLGPQVGRLAETLRRLASERNRGGRTFAAAHSPESPTAEASQHQLGGLHGGDPTGTTPSGGTAAVGDEWEVSKRDLADAIVEVVAALPVYRTYVNSHDSELSDADREYVQVALSEAQRHGRAAPDAINFLGQALLLEGKDGLCESEIHERLNFTERFQQLTGPAAAKGIEDTALYAYVPLVSLNEVGGEPQLPDEDPVTRLHRANEDRLTDWPSAMLGVTTHDTKRTADVRARLDVLTEIPKYWMALVRRWQRLNRAHRARVQGKLAPRASAEYLFYQSVVGVWPSPDPDAPLELPPTSVLNQLRERIEQYMLKAVREAKTRTSWTRNNQPYEDAVLSFVRNSLSQQGESNSHFLSDVQNLVARICRPGFWNSLARTLLQFTVPGTPDLYQGDELWNFALVDPDNRRPVDYPRRSQLLDRGINAMEGPEAARRDFVRDLVRKPEDGAIKLHVIHRVLSSRREHPYLFAGSQYIPLEITGAAREHVLAFARIGTSRSETRDKQRATQEAAIVVVPRLTATLLSSPSDAPVGSDVWADTAIQLPEPLCQRDWTCALTHESFSSASFSSASFSSDVDTSLRVAQVLGVFPCALLLGGPERARRVH